MFINKWLNRYIPSDRFDTAIDVFNLNVFTLPAQTFDDLIEIRYDCNPAIYQTAYSRQILFK
jgi:hypothetical protein